MKRHEDITSRLFASMFTAEDGDEDTKPWDDEKSAALGVTHGYQPTGNARFDALIQALRPSLVYGRPGAGAAYNARSDEIDMPHPAAFGSPSDYLATLAHELSHWTMMRVGRIPHFGNPILYAREEQTAEIACAILLAECSANVDLEARAGYVRAWIMGEVAETAKMSLALGRLPLINEHDQIDTAFTRATEEAERAANFILSAG